MTEQKWLTVAEASVLSRDMGLDRTTKTIRSWSRGEHVTAEKQTNRNGEIWVIERESLITKIKSEIEFRDQERAKNSVQTRSDLSEPVRTGANPDEPRSEADSNQIEELETKVRSLERDKAARDYIVDFLTVQNDKLLEESKGQSRYIGHLETQVLGLGGNPEEHKFLKAPIPEIVTNPEVINSEQTEPHPDQSNLYTG